MVRASDGYNYVAKFAGNPQGTRTLINECIAHWFFQRLGVITPEIRVLRLSREMADQTGLHFQIGNRTVCVAPGLHFGSRCPVDPDKKAIFDFLPANCLQRVANVDDFAKALVLDRLLGQTDARQCVFVRTRSGRKPCPSFTAFMIDHGLMLGGSRWQFEDSSLVRKSLHSPIYSLIDMRGECQRTIDLVRNISECELYAVVDRITPEWFSSGDHDTLTELLGQLVRRTRRLESLVLPHLGTALCAHAEPDLTPGIDTGLLPVPRA